MGLKTTNYLVEAHNITLPEAYARCIEIRADIQGQVVSTFGIYSRREDSMNLDAIDRRYVCFTSDKEQPLWAQAYQKAKELDFEGWTDDIVTDGSEE